jgi:hypothetical protein
MKSRNIILTGLCVAGALLTGSAMARGNDELQWSVTVGGGGPVYSRPAPVYVQPAYPSYPSYHDRQDRGYQQPTRWDRDGDGIPNRRDRVYNPAWDRDGDGVPNRRDPNPDRPAHWRR